MARRALIDAALLVEDHPGNLLQVDPSKLAAILLTRAEPASVGLSPVGGLLLPCSAEDEFAVEVQTRPGPDAAAKGKTLRSPISPGLFETIGLESVERVELGRPVRWSGPGLLAFDGDRELVLDAGEGVELVVERSGPWVIDPRRALREAAERGLFLDMGPWHDHRGGGSSCC